jgi:hypothetical protein
MNSQPSASPPPSFPNILGPSAVSLAVLGMMSRRVPTHNIYAGTVDQVTVAARRQKNRAAAKSRRINRRAK